MNEFTPTFESALVNMVVALVMMDVIVSFTTMFRMGITSRIIIWCLDTIQIIKEKRKFIFNRDEFTKDVFINLNDNKIIIWDDAGFLIHRPDTLEKIKEDGIELMKEYISAMESPDLFFTSAYSSLRIMHIRNVFLIGLVGLIQRVDRLNE